MSDGSLEVRGDDNQARGDGRSARRDELLARVARAGREDAAAAVDFHAAVAAQQDLSLTEEQALDLLERDGPLTAGQLAKLTGLAPASVTGLVDRLQRKGFARRIAHPRDGRRILIEIDPERAARVHPLLAGFIEAMEELHAQYSDEHLETIAGYLTAAAERQRAAAAELEQTDRDGPARETAASEAQPGDWSQGRAG